MRQHINGLRLANYELAADGSGVRLCLQDQAGKPASVALPANAISQLIMTLPGIMQQLLQRQYEDPTFKLVYPVGDWSVEQSTESDMLIVSLKTTDGFSVAFALKRSDLATIARTAARQPVKLLVN